MLIIFYTMPSRYEMNNQLIYEILQIHERLTCNGNLTSTKRFPLMYPPFNPVKIIHDPEVNNLNASAMVINSISTGMLWVCLSRINLTWSVMRKSPSALSFINLNSISVMSLAGVGVVNYHFEV